jgi:hypothetical protein
MSWTALLEFDAACAEDATPDTPPMDWLLAMLKQAMEETMASEAKPLQKANALARLASLYLKASGSAELAKTVKALTRRVAELEEAMAPTGAGSADSTTEPPAVPAALHSAPGAGVLLSSPPRAQAQPPMGRRPAAKHQSRHRR